MPSLLGRGRDLARWALRVARLGPTRRARAELFAIALLMPVKRRVPGLRRRTLRVRLGPAAPGRGFRFRDRSELQALEEVFGGGEYAVELPSPPAVIVDLGANAGQASVYFRMRYPDARIVAVEPDPETFRHLERNLGGDPNVVLRQHAVTARPGPVALTRVPGESWVTRVAGSGEPAAVTVRGATLDELLAEERLDRVDLLKVDIEGLELEVLGASSLRSVGTVIGELHYWMLDVDRGEALRTLQAHGGFERAAFLDHHIFLLSRGRAPTR